MTVFAKALAAPAVLAAISLASASAHAAELSVLSHVPVPTAHNYGPYVGASYGWGWGGRGWGNRHRRGPSVGDVLTGVIVLGTIAAVANAASKPRRPSYPQRYPYPDRRYDYRPDAAQGLEGAADMCLREVERNARAREVTRVERSAGGWLVTGAMADGSAFSCSIGADGRIDRVDIGGTPQAYGTEDRQYDEDTYRSARAGADSAADAGAVPDYPGGPLPGDESEAPEAPDTPGG